MKITTIAVAVMLLLGGCTKVDIQQYRDSSPKLDIFAYFLGETKGWGMVQNRSGKVTRQFVVDINGTINDRGALVLDEKFRWNDGENSGRVWTIVKNGDRNYRGTASDVVGTASGTAYGSVLHWTYGLLVDIDGSRWEVAMDDWMYLQDDQVLINRTTMRKLGINVGEVTIVFSKRP